MIGLRLVGTIEDGLWHHLAMELRHTLPTRYVDVLH